MGRRSRTNRNINDANKENQDTGEARKTIKGLKITPSLLLQGNALDNAGFKPGTIANIEIIKGKITITID